MKKIQAALMAVMFCFSVAACGGSPADQMVNLSKEACECKDAKCFEAVEKKVKELGAKVDKTKEPSKEDKEKGNKAYKAMKDCGKKLKDAPAKK